MSKYVFKEVIIGAIMKVICECVSLTYQDTRDLNILQITYEIVINLGHCNEYGEKVGFTETDQIIFQE